MLAGFHEPEAGSLTVNGADIALPLAPGRFQELGFAFVHQDLGLIEWMSVAENIAMATGYPRRLGRIDWPAAEAEARRALALVDAETFLQVNTLQSGPAILAVAADLGGTRLIDNVLVETVLIGGPTEA